MTDKDPWAYWNAGVESIRKNLGCSIGKAQMIMQNAADSGEVRVRRPPHDENLIGPERQYPGSLTYLRNKTSDLRDRMFSVSDLKYWFNEHYPAVPKAKKAGGAPAKADWPAYHQAFLRKVEDEGWPAPLNPKGWQSQADVARWLMVLAESDRTPVSDTTAKTHARRFLKEGR